MKPLIIKMTEDTPAVILNPKKKVFQIVGDSWIENAYDFYDRIYKWFEDYFNNKPLEETVIMFKYNIISSSSLKQVMRLLLFLKELSKKYKIKIKWFYNDEDGTEDDMYHEGIRLKNVVNLDDDFMEIIPTSKVPSKIFKH